MSDTRESKCAETQKTLRKNIHGTAQSFPMLMQEILEVWNGMFHTLLPSCFLYIRKGEGETVTHTCSCTHMPTCSSVSF